jgi:dTDP-4-dehydrorhamnose 3,5-epimerase
MDITVTPSPLSGVVTVDTKFFRDDRGMFIEAWVKRTYEEHGIVADFVQDNHSRSGAKVLRGLHYQDMTAPMGKLVRCTVGSIFDVAVDLRVGSPTFARWFGVELNADNMTQLWVPPGFAHGFVVLAEPAEVHYKCSGYYTQSAEGAIRWDDPDVGIEWPVEDPVLSQKDAAAPTLQQYLERPAFKYEEG